MGVESKNPAGQQLGDATPDAARRRHITEAKIGGERVAVDLARPAAMGHQRLELRAENDEPTETSPEQRLDAEAVARQREHTLTAIPQGEREHAAHAPRRLLEPPNGASLGDHLGIGMAAEGPARRQKVGAQLLRVIELTIVVEDETAAGRHHRLPAGRREVDDGEPALGKPKACVAIDPYIAFVGTAVDQRAAHGAGTRDQLGAAASTRDVEETGNSAHRSA